MTSPRNSAAGARPRAVLVGVQFPDVDDVAFQGSLAELGRLVDTLGYQVVGTVTQKRESLAASAVLGEGKLQELGQLTGGPGEVPSAAPAPRDKARAKRSGEGGDEAAEDKAAARRGARAARAEALDEEQTADGEPPAPRVDLVAVNHDISPSQARNLERATDVTVLDRTGVIVEIFHRHARSREARLQVEIARLTYLAPRLREGASGGDRQRGGIGGKGAGESAMELDRRKVRDRIAELRAELAAVGREQSTRRARRREARRVALVGYTNAGKSSLMRALTGSEVLVADKLFATLDTTVRALVPEPRPRVLVSDTVGFIHDLPHDLVASFRSTLDEALEASLLLHVVDASDPNFRAQHAVTHEVLADIGATEVPTVLVLNKADRLTPEARADLALEFPEARLMSAHDPRDVAALHAAVVAFFERDMVEEELLVPYDRQALKGEIYERMRVLSETYDEMGARYQVRADPEVLAQLRARLAR